jgi:hypothetical protein
MTKRVDTSLGGAKEGGGINTFPARARAFLKELAKLQKKHQITLAHEDAHGAFEYYDASPEGKAISLHLYGDDPDHGNEEWGAMCWYEDARPKSGRLP